jgi:hypothetical protein
MKALAALFACLIVAASPARAVAIHAMGAHPGGGGHDGHGHRHFFGPSVGAPGVYFPDVTPDAPAPEVVDVPAFIEPPPAALCLPAKPAQHGPKIIYIGAKPATAGPKVIYGTD